MLIKRNLLIMLIIVICFTTGCALSNNGDEITENETTGINSYTVDEFTGGIFNSMSPAMTMNNWFSMISYPPSDYDSWTQKGKIFIYKDDKLETSFSGSDIINQDTVLYCESSLNGQGKKTGRITGTITLTDIPHPETRVQIRNYSFTQYPTSWWNVYKQIDMSAVTGTSATLDWSVPVYETYKPDLEGTFELIVLPGNSMNTYTVAVPKKTTAGNINESVGDIGTISIRGVTLSGTINIKYDGKPVPYVELYATYPVQGTLNITCLSSPEPNAPWSLTYEKNRNSKVDIEFKIMGYSEKDRTIANLLFDISSVKDTNVSVIDNIDVSGIVIDMGDVKIY